LTLNALYLERKFALKTPDSLGVRVANHPCDFRLVNNTIVLDLTNLGVGGAEIAITGSGPASRTRAER
jgi:hypothetical protein